MKLKKFLEKTVNIQTSLQVNQKKLEEFKNDSSFISPINEMDMVKKGSDRVSSSNKLSKPTGHSSKTLKVYFRLKNQLVNKVMMNMKAVLNPKF